MKMGFEEFMNPIIVEDRDIHKQFGYEALAVLDRCFYVAGFQDQMLGYRMRGSQISKTSSETSAMRGGKDKADPSFLQKR